MSQQIGAKDGADYLYQVACAQLWNTEPSFCWGLSGTACQRTETIFFLCGHFTSRVRRLIAPQPPGGRQLSLFSASFNSPHLNHILPALLAPCPLRMKTEVRWVVSRRGGLWWMTPWNVHLYENRLVKNKVRRWDAHHLFPVAPIQLHSNDLVPVKKRKPSFIFYLLYMIGTGFTLKRFWNHMVCFQHWISPFIGSPHCSKGIKFIHFLKRLLRYSDGFIGVQIKVLASGYMVEWLAFRVIVAIPGWSLIGKLGQLGTKCLQQMVRYYVRLQWYFVLCCRLLCDCSTSCIPFKTGVIWIWIISRFLQLRGRGGLARLKKKKWRGWVVKERTKVFIQAVAVSKKNGVALKGLLVCSDV